MCVCSGFGGGGANSTQRHQTTGLNLLLGHVGMDRECVLPSTASESLIKKGKKEGTEDRGQNKDDNKIIDEDEKARGVNN